MSTFFIEVRISANKYSLHYLAYRNIGDYDNHMAKAEVTKRSLADAMKRLLHKMPYEKVSVSTIAEEAKMNRKSFYYHFNSKSELVNWILDSEFKAYLETTPEEEKGWEVIEMLGSYLYKERLFYCSVLNSTGYSSLTGIMFPVICSYMRDIFEMPEGNDGLIILAADCFLAAIFRWLQSDENMEPEIFVENLRLRFLRLSEEFSKRLC